MESLPPLQFSIGTNFNLSSGRRRREESRKRLRPDVDFSSPSQDHFKNTTCISTLFPSLLSIVKDCPSNIKITLAVESKSLKARRNCLEKQRFENYRLKKITNNHFLLPNQKNYEHKSLLDDYIEQLDYWFKVEQKVRFQMRKLVQRWLVAKYKSRILNHEDPCTMEPITNPVKIFDMAARGYFQFDPVSLRRTFDFSLGFQDWMFPEPLMPKNPLTNLEFTVGQMLVVIQGMRTANVGSWMIEAFKTHNFNLKEFRRFHYFSLEMNALKQLYMNPTSDQTLEFLIEFIEDQWEEHEMSRGSIKTILRWAVLHEMDDPYMKQWLDAWYKYNQIKVRYGRESDQLNVVYVKTLALLENSQKIAEIGERRAASIKKVQPPPQPQTQSQSVQFPVSISPVLQVPFTLPSHMTNLLQNPMFTMPLLTPPVLNPEDVDPDTNTETDDDGIVITEAPEVAALIQFLTTLFVDDTQNSPPSDN